MTRQTSEQAERDVKLPLGTSPSRELPFILTIDPGTTTGWALYNPFTGDVECGQLGPWPHHMILHDFVLDTLTTAGQFERELVVVYESFEFRQQRERDNLVLDSREYIGVVKLAKQEADFVVENDSEEQTFEIVSFTASAGKFFVGDKKLRMLGWYEPTAGQPHARDALRHLCRHLVVNLRSRLVTDKWFGELYGRSETASS